MVTECNSNHSGMQHNLPELLRLPEGEHLDFKQRISSAEKIAKTLCAFANTRGGILLIGVKDDHTVTGIDPEEEKYMLEQAAQTFCHPPIQLLFEELEDDEDRTVLHVLVEESQEKPHSCRNQQGEWQVYVRQRDKTIPAGNQSIRRMQSGADESSLDLDEVALTKHEKSILQYLELHQRITVKQLMVMLNFSQRRAQRLLQQMVEKNLLRCFEHEREDYYV